MGENLGKYRHRQNPLLILQRKILNVDNKAEIKVSWYHDFDVLTCSQFLKHTVRKLCELTQIKLPIEIK